MKRLIQHLPSLAMFTLLAVAPGLTGCRSDDRSMADKRSDRQVAHEVRKELSQDSKYQYPGVVPLVEDGTVQLTGFVDTPEQRLRAAELAAHAKGAREIVNSISLKPVPTGPVLVRSTATNAPAPASEATVRPPARSGRPAVRAPKSEL